MCPLQAKICSPPLHPTSHHVIQPWFIQEGTDHLPQFQRHTHLASDTHAQSHTEHSPSRRWFPPSCLCLTDNLTQEGAD